MKQRVITGTLLILFLAVMLWLPGWCMAIATLIATGLSLWEQFHALSGKGYRIVAWPAWMVLVASVPLTLVIGVKVIIPLLALAVFLVMGIVLFRRDPELNDLCMSVLPLLAVVLPGLSLVALSLVEQHAVEVILLTITYAVPLLGDTVALFVGSAIGGPKLCPAVSPKKTIAGSLGGLAGSIAAAMLVYAASLVFCNAATLAKLPLWWHYLLLGLAGGVVGQVGDLFASLVKRHCEIKDYSNLFPGHGGMLDRLDSVLLMAVMMYCYRLFV